MKRIFLPLLFLLIPLSVWGATYYVDPNVVDTNVASATPDFTTFNPATFTTGVDGTSSVFKTIADINAFATLQPGDFVYARKGQTWREKLTVPASGSAGLPITFGGFGSGADPIITAANLMGTWVTVVPAAVTGAVTRTNMRLSLATNNAFVDFNASGTLTPYLGYKLTISDHNGKKLIGYIKAAGTGEQYTELVTNGTLESSSSVPSMNAVDFTYYLATGARSNTVAHGGTYSWKATATSASISCSMRDIPGTYLFGSLMKADLWMYIPSGQTANTLKSQMQINSVLTTWNTTALTNTWVESTSYFNPVASTDRYPNVQFNNIGAIDDVFYLDDISVKQVTAPAVGGVTITSTAGGVDYNWTSEEATFIRNDAAGYTYSIEMELPANVWIKTGVTTGVNVLLYDGIRGIYNANFLALAATGQWSYNSTTDILFIYSATDPDTAFTNPGIEADQRSVCIFNTRDYITFQNLDLRVAQYDCLQITSVDRILNKTIVDSVTTSYAAQHGIKFVNGNTANVNGGGIVRNSIAHNNGGSGIRGWKEGAGAISGMLVENNTAYSNCWDAALLDNAGISMFGTSDSIVQRNTTYNNGDALPNFQDHTLMVRSGHGIHFDTVGANMIARYNLIYNNNHSNLTCEVSNGVQIYYNISYSSPGACGISIWSWGGTPVANTLCYNNTCYGNWAGIGVRSDAGVAGTITGNIVKNNISSGNIFALVAINGGENDGVNGSGNVYLNNCFGTEAANFITWGAATPDTYDVWETAYGATTSSVEADPLFVTPGSDFHLLAASPCINAGIGVGLTSDYEGNTVPKGSAPDMGAYEYPSGKRPVGISRDGSCISNGQYKITIH